MTEGAYKAIGKPHGIMVDAEQALELLMGARYENEGVIPKFKLHTKDGGIITLFTTNEIEAMYSLALELRKDAFDDAKYDFEQIEVSGVK